MMKKNLISIYSFIFLILLVSCTKKVVKPLAPDANLTLAVRSGIYAEVIKKCLTEFEVRNNIACKVIEFSEEDLHKEIAEDSLNEKSSYDLCMVDGSWFAEFKSKNILSDLGLLGYQLDDDIIPATKSICYSDNGLYLAPYYGNVTVLLYNKLMVQEAGYKSEDIQSLEDILEICRFQKKRHNLGFLYRGDTENNLVVDFLPFLCSRGAWVLDENNKPCVNSQAFVEAMHFYLNIIQTGRAAKKDDLIASIANKSASMGIGWPGWYTPTKNSSMDYLALSGKYRDDKPAYNSNVYGIWALGIPKNCANKEAAIQLLSFLMDKDVQKSTVFYGGLPCRYSSLQDKEILEKFPQYRVICKALEAGVYRPVIEEWPEFYTILGRQMKYIIDGEKLVKEGLDDAQRELEILMRR